MVVVVVVVVLSRCVSVDGPFRQLKVFWCGSNTQALFGGNQSK